MNLIHQQGTFYEKLRVLPPTLIFIIREFQSVILTHVPDYILFATSNVFVIISQNWSHEKSKV